MEGPVPGIAWEFVQFVDVPVLVVWEEFWSGEVHHSRSHPTAGSRIRFGCFFPVDLIVRGKLDILARQFFKPRSVACEAHAR